MKSIRLFFPAFVALGLMLSNGEAFTDVNLAGGSSNLSIPLAIGSPTPMPKPKFLKAIPSALISTNDTNGFIIDLTKHFKAAPAPSDQVFVTTSSGNFYLQLFPSNAPVTVANFLRYVNDGAYENTLVHKKANTPAVLETGEYTLDNFLSPISTWDPITNEYSLSNTRGMVAMYKPGSNPNGASSGWFINLADNSSLLDTNDGGYTVFAQVLGNGMSNVVDAMGAVPAYNISSFPDTSEFTDLTGPPDFAPFTSIPLQHFSGGYLSHYDFVSISHVMTLPYFAVSSDPTAFSTEIQGTNLVVKFLSYSPNDVTITTYATDTNGNSVGTSFAVAPTPKGSQTITFPANPPQPYSKQPYTFNNFSNYPTASSSLVPYVTIKSGPAKIAKYQGYNQFFFTGAGTVTMIAQQPGNTSYNAAAKVTNTVVVTKADQTITPFPSIASTNVTKFPYFFTLSTLPTASSALPVKILISGPAKISGKKITVTAAQQVTLTAGQVGNAFYNPAPNQTTNFLVSLKVAIPFGISKISGISESN